MTIIGKSAFDGCYILTSINIPDGVTTIGQFAFDGCYILTSINIPDSVSSIGEGAFFFTTTIYGIPGSYAQDYAKDNGYKFYCSCDHVFADDYEEIYDYNCMEGIRSRKCEKCDYKEEVVLPPLEEHNWCLRKGGNWVDLPDELVCDVCGSCRDTSVNRFAGNDRFDTARIVADNMLFCNPFGENMHYDSGWRGPMFKNIVVASGTDWADALAGSYLATKKGAPLILAANGKNGAVMDEVTEYIKNNISEEVGKIYVLGGTGAVPASFEEKMGEEFSSKIVRISGKDRYETNLKILEEAGIEDGDDILVCTGLSYADALSASATERPILLVPGNRLLSRDNYDQTEYLKSLGGKHDFYIIGGEGAVTESVAESLKELGYGSVTRVAGKGRHETSIEVAKTFFDMPDAISFVYAQNFPDGLVAGTWGRPIILTENSEKIIELDREYVENYTTKQEASDYNVFGTVWTTVFGGETLISTDTICKILYGKTLKKWSKI